MTCEPTRRRLFDRCRKIGLTTLGVSLAAGCSTLGFDDGVQTARVGDTPYYATNSLAMSADTGAHTGVAAWDGDVSASGKTAAHATLLPGSWARVTNTQTGGSAIVRVTRSLQNAPDRNIELSRDAAIDVGALHEGFATVLIEPIDPRQASAQQRLMTQPVATAPQPVETLAYAAPVAPAAPAAPRYTPQIETSSVAFSAAPAAAPWPNRRTVATSAPVERQAASAVAGPRYVQLGSFRNSTFAQRARADLVRQGLAGGAYGAAFVEPAYVNGAVYHRVRLGPIETSQLAQRALSEVRRAGHQGAKLIKP